MTTTFTFRHIGELNAQTNTYIRILEKGIKMKRKLIKTFAGILMSLGLVMASFVTASAIDVCDELTGYCPPYIIDSAYGLNEEDFKEANAELAAIGSAILRQRSNWSASLNVHLFLQSGQPWSNDMMRTCNRTIGNSGCLVTSFAMVNMFFGNSRNPGQVNTAMGNNACDWVWSAATTTFPGITLHSFSGTGNSFNNPIPVDTAIHQALGAIQMGIPPIIGLITSYGRTHFVVATGFNGHTIFLNDPSPFHNFRTLQDALNAGWRVHRFAAYRGPNLRPPMMCDPWGTCIFSISLPEADEFMYEYAITCNV